MSIRASSRQSLTIRTLVRRAAWSGAQQLSLLWACNSCRDSKMRNNSVVTEEPMRDRPIMTPQEWDAMRADWLAWFSRYRPSRDELEKLIEWASRKLVEDRPKSRIAR